MKNNFDVIVVGGGHAGVEAALASARLNKRTLLINLDVHHLAVMPCNPSIGGPAKGIVVREIDALGGEMAKAADATALQVKLLNSSRGPGVWALRAQSDKIEYSRYFTKIVHAQPNLELLEDAVQDLVVENQRIKGVKTEKHGLIRAKAVVLTTGTYLQSLVHKGPESQKSGPHGNRTTSGISEALKREKVELIRFKTGTPPRVYRDSVDLSHAQLECGTDSPLAFSFETEGFTRVQDQEPCYLIHSTLETKKIVLKNLDKSPMYSGHIQSAGPRYCPSFEDKIVRFPQKDTHQIFIEPETKNGDTWYIQGFSTSMPIEIQEKMLKSLPGFKKVRVKHWAYAIEYDLINPTQLKPSLELKAIRGLFSAGQINGTSGYEEAAGQGLIAGINAARFVERKKPLVLRRDEAYIGVMIDDLINKGVWEPYRLLTSRAEHRLLLRHDNAEARLKHYGHQVGLVSQEAYENYLQSAREIEKVKKHLKELRFTPKSDLAIFLKEQRGVILNRGYSAWELVKMPTIDPGDLITFIPELKELKFNQLQSLVIGARFAGYIAKERELVEKMRRLERKKIPEDIDYHSIPNLATEARQRLAKVRPLNVGQASRITGVNPADIQMLLFYLKNKYSTQK